MTASIQAHGPVRILIAPDAFKGTLRADAAADAIAAGIASVRPNARLTLLPLADGGDGTVAALAAAGFDRRPVITRGPTGVPTVADTAHRGPVAVVELASACGIALLPAGGLAPTTSSTLGLGDAVTAALDADPEELVLCLGGSASTDGGAGLLAALGARLLAADGRPVPPCGATLPLVDRIDLAGLDGRLADVRVRVATDVRSPLLGPDGAAAVFGPQKGAAPAEVAALERGLTAWARVLAATTGVDAADVPGAGAAGGTGLAAIAALGAEPVSGAGFVHDAVGLAAQVAEADLVVTGEGRLDTTSLLGKGVADVARLCRTAGVPVVAVCGQVALTEANARAAGFAATVDVSALRGAESLRAPAQAVTAAVRSALS